MELLLMIPEPVRILVALIFIALSVGTLVNKSHEKRQVQVKQINEAVADNTFNQQFRSGDTSFVLSKFDVIFLGSVILAIVFIMCFL